MHCCVEADTSCLDCLIIIKWWLNIWAQFHRAFVHPLTKQQSLFSFTHLEEGADGLRGGVAQDGVQHRLADLANQSLALAAVGRGQDNADLLQQVNHSALEDIYEPVSPLCNCAFVLAPRVCFTSVLSFGNNFSRVLTNRRQKLHSCPWSSGTKRGIRWVDPPGPLDLNSLFFSLRFGLRTFSVTWAAWKGSFMKSWSNFSCFSQSPMTLHTSDGF